MDASTRTALVIAFAVVALLLLLFGGGMMSGTIMSGGMMGAEAWVDSAGCGFPPCWSWYWASHSSRSSPERSNVGSRIAGSTNMLSWTRNSAGTSEARRPRALRGFARAGLVMAWVVLWLNTLLFPCCATIAAAFDGRETNVSQSVSAMAPAHHLDDAHSAPEPHGPDLACAYSLGTGSTIVGEYVVPTADRSSQGWFAVDVSQTTSLAAINRSANLALARAAPPRSHRLYRRTQRLLI